MQRNSNKKGKHSDVTPKGKLRGEKKCLGLAEIQMALK